MSFLQNKRVLLGVTGGIAAYKSADLVRKLIEQGAEVQVVMTHGAQAFVQPLTYQALSGNPVHTALLDPEAEAGMGHIELARWADLILIAPASANFLARLANGMADDLLSTLCLATRAPIITAPAMNQQMWKSPATQKNSDILQQRGVYQFGPASGEQACGDVGPGRMLEPLEIIESLLKQFSNKGLLQNLNVLITAGPTQEALDPVRYITNHSSGKMGYAIAEAARNAGASVTLVSGPVALQSPDDVNIIGVTSANDMFNAVMENIEQQQIFISAAAVADYTYADPAEQKIKKSASEGMTLTLQRTEDVLARVAALENPPFTVGFAAETEKLEEHARDKLNRKALNMIAANRVDDPALGFNSDDNALLVLWQGGAMELPRATKQNLASDLIELVANTYNRQN